MVRTYICLLCLVSLISLFANGQENKVSINHVNKNFIEEEKFLLVNGIEQWVTIKGARSKPVLLFLHGGPGSPISPYSANMYKEWEKDFIIVQWDQRGAGRTFGRNAPEELSPEYLKANPLTLEQMTKDGIMLSEYLKNHLSKKKIILFGTSWGSVLAVKMVTSRPDLFYAYVGHSQVVRPAIDEEFYQNVYSMAEKRNDKEAIDLLKAIGKPPYDRARKVGQLFRVVKKFERENSVPAPESWFVVAPAYDNDKDNQHRSDGDDYSFVNYTGDSMLSVRAMSSTINLMRDHVDFKVPVYIIQGEEDILTPKEKTEKYFNLIKAPEKKYYLLPKTAHGFNAAVLETQYKICKEVRVF